MRKSAGLRHECQAVGRQSKSATCGSQCAEEAHPGPGDVVGDARLSNDSEIEGRVMKHDDVVLGEVHGLSEDVAPLRAALDGGRVDAMEPCIHAVEVVEPCRRFDQ